MSAFFYHVMRVIVHIPGPKKKKKEEKKQNLVMVGGWQKANDSDDPIY